MTGFYGDYTHALDSQCRVSLPCDWRKKDGETELILAPTGDRALLLLPPDLLESFFARMKNASITNSKIQKALADFGRLCRRCKCDKHGRIALDRDMLDRVGISEQIQLSGAVTHIRVSAPAAEEVTDIAAALAALDEVSASLDGSLDAAIKKALKGR